MGFDRTEYVSLWHPWKDKKGSGRSLSLWKNGEIETNTGAWTVHSIPDILEVVGSTKMYCFCNDILDTHEFPMSTELLRHEYRPGKKSCEAYPTPTGGIVALKVRKGRNCGYFIPASVWGLGHGKPTMEFLGEVQFLFKLFGFEALSPSSLSEKVLRSTLPDRCYISRPSAMLRQTLLDNAKGGRIDSVETGKFYRTVFEYDLRKAYLTFSRHVVSPYHAPQYFYGHRDIFTDFACSYVKCTFTVHGTGIHPIQIKDEVKMKQRLSFPFETVEDFILRKPREGETLTQWLWDEELKDCLEKGYTLHEIERGYGWHEMSTFMEEWSDILWEKYQEYELPTIKTMMVGVPGRFLRKPEICTLVHISEIQKGDVPILANWGDDKRTGTEWAIRTEYDLQSAQLTHVGLHIVMQCRQDIYRKMLEEEKRGNEVLRSYIDCYSVSQPTKTPENLGVNIGQMKETEHSEVWLEENRMLSKQAYDMPGISGVFRKAEIAKYKKIVQEKHLEVGV